MGESPLSRWTSAFGNFLTPPRPKSYLPFEMTTEMFPEYQQSAYDRPADPRCKDFASPNGRLSPHSPLPAPPPGSYTTQHVIKSSGYTPDMQQTFAEATRPKEQPKMDLMDTDPDKAFIFGSVALDPTPFAPAIMHNHAMAQHADRSQRRLKQEQRGCHERARKAEATHRGEQSSRTKRIESDLIDAYARIESLEKEWKADRLEAKQINKDNNKALKHLNNIIDELEDEVSSYETQYKQQLARGNRLQQKHEEELAKSTGLSSEVTRLRQEISASTSIIPVSSRTEEDYFLELRGLNQKVQDLANYVVRELAPKGLLGTKKERRAYAQGVMHASIWKLVFGRLIAYSCDEDERSMSKVYASIDPNHKRVWKSMTFSSFDKMYAKSQIHGWIVRLVNETIGMGVGTFSEETNKMLTDIMVKAVEIQFSLGKEGKNVDIIYAAATSLFDPVTMKDVNDKDNSNEDDDTRSIDTVIHHTQFTTRTTTNGSPRLVTQCIGFGFRGSSGIGQKCLVVLAPVSVDKDLLLD